MYYVLLGLACSTIAVIPGYRPGGLPIAYLLVGIAWIWGLRRGLHFQAAESQVICAFGVASTIPLAYLLLSGDPTDLALAVRTLVGFSAFILVVGTTREPSQLETIALATVPAYLVNASFGIGQYFHLLEAVIGSTFFIADDTEHVLAALRGLNIRPWGINGYPHVYAFSVALWTLFLAGVLSATEYGAPRGRRYTRVLTRSVMMLAIILGLIATVTSGQRTAVWVTVVALIALWLVNRKIGGFTKFLGLVMAAIFIAGTLPLLSDTDDVISRLSTVQDDAQFERSETWRQAADMIEEDPFLGTAYRVQPGHRGIHNGVLGGWARHGLLWVAAIFVCFALLGRLLVVSRGQPVARAAGAVLALEILAHAAAHTNFITTGDLIAWPYLGFILVLARASIRVTDAGTMRTALLANER